jgi:hypothetical protein
MPSPMSLSSRSNDLMGEHVKNDPFAKDDYKSTIDKRKTTIGECISA